MDCGRRIRTDGVRDGRIMAHYRQWITAVCNTGVGRRVTAGGSRQRCRCGRRITEGTGVERVRRERHADDRLVDYAADTEETDYGREVGGRYRWITARLIRQTVGRVSVGEADYEEDDSVGSWQTVARR